MANQHNWIAETKTARYADFYTCSLCGAKKHHCWTEGWPSWNDFFDSKGHEVQEEPPCIATDKKAAEIEFPINHLEALGIDKLKPYIPPTKETPQRILIERAWFEYKLRQWKRNFLKQEKMFRNEDEDMSESFGELAEGLDYILHVGKDLSDKDILKKLSEEQLNDANEDEDDDDRDEEVD